MMTDSSGAGILPAMYTAFGEIIAGESDRYGYAGAYGYQSHDDFPFLHVGHRYYDPATGRFLQRDPIGIRGGANVYAYAALVPTIVIDPDGLHPAGDALQKSANYGYKVGGIAIACGYAAEVTGVGVPVGIALQTAGAFTVIVAAVVDLIGAIINWLL